MIVVGSAVVTGCSVAVLVDSKVVVVGLAALVVAYKIFDDERIVCMGSAVVVVE